MNREEYLNQLKKHLRKLPKSDYENAMEYFTEYFEEVGEHQAVEELGTPEEAAADIINNLLNQNQKNGKAGGKQEKIKILSGIFVLLFGAAVIVFLLNMGSRKGNGGLEDGTGNIKAGNIQKNDTDGTQNGEKDTSGIKIWQSEDIRLDSVGSIEADLNYIDLKIAVSDDKDFHMSYELHCMNHNNPLSYHLQDGLLKLEEADFKVPSLRSWIWSTDSMANNYYSYITLYVPSGIVLKSCDLNMADGDLRINGLNCNLMKIESADGDMNIRDGSCQKAVLKTEDGDIIFSNAAIAEDLQIDTADGDISLSGLSAKGTVEIVSGDGDITISGFKESAGLFLQTEYGDISGSSIDITGKMQVNTTDGDVTLSNFGAFGKIDIVSECGDISFQIQKKSLPDLKMMVDTGDGDLSIARSLGGRKRSGHYERDGSVSTYLNINTEEGDVSIQ